ncbi:MAG: glycosyltransferase family 4 protein [PVC group bacterium]
MRIDQILAGFMPGDAISNYALELKKLFQSWGCQSDIFVRPENTDDRARHLCRPVSEHAGLSSPDNILIYHFSIGSDATNYFRAVPDRRVIIYHNITPAKYYDVILPETAAFLREGREQLKELAKVTELALGVSEYNRRELEGAGFARTGVVPLTNNWSTLDETPSRKVLLTHHGSRGNLLFVGRLVPNKKFEDLLRVFYYYKNLLQPASKLFLVGFTRGSETYLRYLRAIIQELDLKDVVFTGHVTNSELLAYYRLASVYLCLSEHEGFCMPLMEAMHFGIPVLAYAGGAVPDTLNGAGVLVREKSSPAIAEMAALLCDDDAFRRMIVEGQFRRLKEFRSISLKDKLKQYIEPWLK